MANSAKMSLKMAEKKIKDCLHMLIHANNRGKARSWNRSLTDLTHEIDAHEVVSFDIFDTLIMRKTLKPGDVFDLVERELGEEGEDVPFSEWRIAAERKLLQNGRQPNFDDIYECLKSEHVLSSTKVNHWKEKEWLWEEKLLAPRQVMIDVLAYAKESGKTICLTSDMYFSKPYIEQILKKHGISGYDAIFVSCDYQKTKDDGHLFECVLDFAKGRSVLHIGDNEHSDCKMPKRFGIDTFRIWRASDLLEASSSAHALKAVVSLEDRLLIGTLVFHAFNDPFVLSRTNGRVQISDCEEFARWYLLPITMRFLQFISETVSGARDAVVLFLSRDGYFFHKAYASLAKKMNLPDSVYFYASRQAANGVMVQDEDDINLFLDIILQRKNQNLKTQLEYFFSVQFDDSFDVSVADACVHGSDAIVRKVKGEKVRIFAAQKMNRECYLSYIDGLHLQRYKKAFCVDIVTKGTTVRCLTKLLHIPVDLIAFGGLEALSKFLPDRDRWHLLYGIMKKHVKILPWFPVLEVPYASQESQLKKFSGGGEGCLCKGDGIQCSVFERRAVRPLRRTGFFCRRTVAATSPDG